MQIMAEFIKLFTIVIYSLSLTLSSWSHVCSHKYLAWVKQYEIDKHPSLLHKKVLEHLAQKLFKLATTFLEILELI
jgi:hypothetical protein